MDVLIFKIQLQRNLNRNSPMSAVIGPPRLPTMLTCIVKIFIRNPLMDAVIGPLDMRPKDVLQLHIRSFELRVPSPWNKIMSRMCSRLHHSRLYPNNILCFFHSMQIPRGICNPSGEFQIRTSPNRRKKKCWTFTVWHLLRGGPAFAHKLQH